MSKQRIQEVIVVEGRYDKNILSQVVDATIVETGGFSVFNDREKLSFLRTLAQKRGIILLTDSDGAGFVIRNYLKGARPRDRVKQAYIPDIPGKELRRLYTARMAIDGGKDRFWLMELWQMRSDYPAKLLLQAARNVDHEWCKRSLTACQVLDRRMKSEKNIDREGELTKFVLELAQK